MYCVVVPDMKQRDQFSNQRRYLETGKQQNNVPSSVMFKNIVSLCKEHDTAKYSSGDFT